MQDSISNTIIPSGVDKIEHLSNDIVSNANQIRAIVQPMDDVPSWAKPIIDLFHIESNEILQLFHMDGWNLFVTLFVYALALYVWIVGIPYCICCFRKRKKNQNRYGHVKENKSNKTLMRTVWKVLTIIPKHVILLPWDIVNYGFTIWEYFYENPIKRDRELFSTDGFPLLSLSFKIAIFLSVFLSKSHTIKKRR